MTRAGFKTGEAAKVRHSIHSPYSGRTGTILEIDHFDPRGPYLVVFSDGLQFRYQSQELDPPYAVEHAGMIQTIFRVVAETRHGLWRGSH
jgi:hypothetical protein